MNEVIEKARRLLQLRDRAATPGEAQAAARALAKMLDKHRISIAELEMRGDQDAEPMAVDEREPLLKYTRLPLWKKDLIHALCKHYGVACWRNGKVQGYTLRGHRKVSYAMHLCGRKSDMDMVRYMLAWLSTETENLSRQECEGLGSVSHNSWRRGFVKGIKKQLQMARDDVASTSSDAALVLRKRRDDASDFLHKMVDLTGKPKKSYHRLYHDPDAHAAGVRRGQAQHLGDRLDSGLHRALPSGGSPP
jgi:hypothetical protein